MMVGFRFFYYPVFIMVDIVTNFVFARICVELSGRDFTEELLCPSKVGVGCVPHHFASPFW
jgi:hypothetical protein